jgi:hypothetical protein
MRRIWLGLVCGALIAVAPCASAQDLNAALLHYTCGAQNPPPAVPNGARASAEQMQAFVTAATAWQTAQQTYGHCLFTASSAMDAQISTRLTTHNQHVAAGQQASAAWQAAVGPASSSHHE